MLTAFVHQCVVVIVRIAWDSTTYHYTLYTRPVVYGVLHGVAHHSILHHTT